MGANVAACCPRVPSAYPPDVRAAQRQLDRALAALRTSARTATGPVPPPEPATGSGSSPSHYARAALGYERRSCIKNVALGAQWI